MVLLFVKAAPDDRSWLTTQEHQHLTVRLVGFLKFKAFSPCWVFLVPCLCSSWPAPQSTVHRMKHGLRCLLPRWLQESLSHTKMTEWNSASHFCSRNMAFSAKMKEGEQSFLSPGDFCARTLTKLPAMMLQLSCALRLDTKIKFIVFSVSQRQNSLVHHFQRWGQVSCSVIDLLFAGERTWGC